MCIEMITVLLWIVQFLRGEHGGSRHGRVAGVVVMGLLATKRYHVPCGAEITAKACGEHARLRLDP